MRFVSCGWRHSLFIDTDGRLHSCGWNKYGQLGLADNLDCNTPRPVEHLSHVEVRTCGCTRAVAPAALVLVWIINLCTSVQC